MTRLKQSREGISQISAKAQAGDWDAVRQAVSFTLPFLSVKGYTGESVKSRAVTLTDDVKNQVIAQRQALLVALGTLDKAAYNVQTGKAKPLDVAETITSCADDALAAIDGIIIRLSTE